MVEGWLEYSPALPFYTGRRVLLVNGTVGYFSFASKPPEARGVVLETAKLIRLWEGLRRVFLVVRRPRGQSVVGDDGGSHSGDRRRRDPSTAVPGHDDGRTMRAVVFVTETTRKRTARQDLRCLAWRSASDRG